jgi:hypothetical protein
MVDELDLPDLGRGRAGLVRLRPVGPIAAVGIALLPPAVGREEGDDAEGRQLDELLDVLGPLDGVVEILDEEDQPEPAEEADDRAMRRFLTFGVNGPDGTRARSTTLMLLVRRPPSWLETWISFCLATRVLSRVRMFSTSVLSVW